MRRSRSSVMPLYIRPAAVRRAATHARFVHQVPIAGLWTLISPCVAFGAAHAAHTNDIVVGIVVLILGFANAVFRVARPVARVTVQQREGTPAWCPLRV